ncbi:MULTISPECIES: peptidylprolyl isomerase [unclassified Enterococcus]|uniref:peptidylprolyl isomerase n=1 Tax=unclassified Enterococcus TaxID=2608891 RepID=UPI001554899E|nr:MULTISPECIES: peptidylprolyl isomerase [unclassified Enterococcus]MBS7577470.1 peptidylprolyl isomerase [Enterococcus sp. MMGLQ5-2]MBS7584876.1 peptidylprolyl isomerase [Enterococcus sp. MMGLQ5-1]NPD12731.1 peptidylprolyl isomerase [Enterococcus sp. MMGLQ5-1]NPD37302.1 peptidylprolyl isomerase [Enterococcus sp. MMGLQ5-2]
MKKSKKVIAGVVSLVAVATLAACSSSKDIVTMKGATITVEDFYDKAKTQSTSQSIVRDLTIYKVFTDKYGDKVSKDDVNDAFDKQKDSYNEQNATDDDKNPFATALSSAGYTEATFKEYLKNNLSLEAGLKANIEIKDADLKTAWESFHPEVTASIIKADSEDDAKAILASVQAEGADFASIAKDKSTDTETKADGGQVKFDSTSTTVPAEVQTAAWDLADGEIYGSVISSTNSSTYTTSYYVLKMDKNSKKGNDMSKYKKELKKIAEETKLNDQTFVTEVIAKELKAANVKVKDSAFDSALSSFISTDSSSSSSSTTSSSSSSSSK